MPDVIFSNICEDEWKYPSGASKESQHKASLQQEVIKIDKQAPVHQDSSSRYPTHGHTLSRGDGMT